MVRPKVETGAVVTVQMSYLDYVNLKKFLEDIGEFNYPLDLDAVAALRRRALDAVKSIY